MADASSKRESPAAALPPPPPTRTRAGTFTQLVLERDKCCVRCRSIERLHAYRIKPKDTHPELWNDPDNGQALCGRHYTEAMRDRKDNRRGVRKPNRGTLEKRIKMLAQEVEDLKSANDKLRQPQGAMLPLDYVMKVLNNPESSTSEKQWAAAQGLPYFHRRMPLAIEGGDHEKPTRIIAHDQLTVLSAEEFAAVRKLSQSTRKALPSPAEVMAQIAATALEGELVEESAQKPR